MKYLAWAFCSIGSFGVCYWMASNSAPWWTYALLVLALMGTQIDAVAYTEARLGSPQSEQDKTS